MSLRIHQASSHNSIHRDFHVSVLSTSFSLGTLENAIREYFRSSIPYPMNLLQLLAISYPRTSLHKVLSWTPST